MCAESTTNIKTRHGSPIDHLPESNFRHFGWELFTQWTKITNPIFLILSNLAPTKYLGPSEELFEKETHAH